MQDFVSLKYRVRVNTSADSHLSPSTLLSPPRLRPDMQGSAHTNLDQVRALTFSRERTETSLKYLHLFSCVKMRLFRHPRTHGGAEQGFYS